MAQILKTFVFASIVLSNVYFVKAAIDLYPILAKVSGVNDVVSFAKNVLGVVTGESLSISNEELLKDIQHSIEAAKTEVLNSITSQARYEQIDDAVITVGSSLKDLQDYLQATSSEKDSYKQQFIDRFDSNAAIKHIRFLPELLTYTIPGTSGDTLINLFTASAKCNRNRIRSFKTFYMNLISDGIALEVAYLQMKNLNADQTVTDWTAEMTPIRNIFQTLEDSCWCETSGGKSISISVTSLLYCVTVLLTVFV